MKTMKTNNSYLKHQMKILSQHEGVTVEAREKAFEYVVKKMKEMTDTILTLEDEIQAMTNEMELMKKKLDTSKEKKPAKKTKKA